MQQDIDSILTVADRLSTVTMTSALILILIGNFFEVWVWGWQHRRTKAQLDRALQLLAKGQNLVEKVVLPDKDKDEL